MTAPSTTRTAPQRKVKKFTETKLFIASLAVAVTVGVWNLLAGDAYAQTKAAPKPVTAPPPQSGAAQDPAYGIPTIVPLVEVNLNTAAQAPAAAANQQAAQPAGTGQLRAVTAPTQVIVQKVKPVFGQSVNVVNVNNGGSGGSGSVATTRSSR